MTGPDIIDNPSSHARQNCSIEVIGPESGRRPRLKHSRYPAARRARLRLLGFATATELRGVELI